jgi:hypothetical protein
MKWPIFEERRRRRRRRRRRLREEEVADAGRDRATP